ncbi:uncharacterized protein RCC_01260 [Ramularia collo-cygni]|uniref:Uncharacterized protein n=1 Tax=Ramularia collo-cygni TaxID=112498 RepID=A0A2D3US46_9PEZI|nr:uncharacterized protein RCC_01260 [Ramularia collo-cygni]CZT15400.1 uncharacterized protein RCC_01260 [Ramularia collo-cygni]
MGLTKKNKAKPDGEADAAAAPDAAATTFPSAPSTTELLLRGEREKSQSAYQRAQKAERAYRAKKEADRARGDYKSTKSHFRTSCMELKLGLKSAFGAMRASPAVVQEKRTRAESKAEIRKAKKDEAERKKLEEKLKKAEEKAKLEGEGAAEAEEAAA